MKPAEFVKRIRVELERHPGDFSISEGATDRDLREFHELLARTAPQCAGMTLPEDLVGLLRLANGIGLQWDYFSLLLLARWQLARVAMFGPGPYTLPGQEYPSPTARDELLRRELPDSLWTISDHADGTQFVAVDLRSGEYFDADAYDCPPRKIGDSVDSLLDWVWKHWVEDLRQ